MAFLGALTGKMPAHFMTVPVLPIGGGEGDLWSRLDAIDKGVTGQRLAARRYNRSSIY